MDLLESETIKLIHKHHNCLMVTQREQGTVSFKDMLQAMELLAFEVSDKTKELLKEKGGD